MEDEPWGISKNPNWKRPLGDWMVWFREREDPVVRFFGAAARHPPWLDKRKQKKKKQKKKMVIRVRESVDFLQVSID